MRRTRLLSRPIEHLERSLHLSVAFVLSVKIARSCNPVDRSSPMSKQMNDTAAAAHDRRHGDLIRALAAL